MVDEKPLVGLCLHFNLEEPVNFTGRVTDFTGSVLELLQTIYPAVFDE